MLDDESSDQAPSSAAVLQRAPMALLTGMGSAWNQQGWKGALEIIVSNPCHGRATWSRAHRNVFTVGFECLQRDSTSPLCSLCQCSDSLNRKKFYLMLR